MLVFTYVVTRFTHKTKRNHSIFVPSRREKENQSKCLPHHQPNRSPFCIERKKEGKTISVWCCPCMHTPSFSNRTFFLPVLSRQGIWRDGKKIEDLLGSSVVVVVFGRGKEEKHLLIIQCSFRSLVKVTPRSGFIPYTPSPLPQPQDCKGTRRLTLDY